MLTQNKIQELQAAFGELLDDYRGVFEKILGDVDPLNDEFVAISLGTELAKLCIKADVSKERFLEHASMAYEAARFVNKIVAAHEGH